MRNKIIGIDIDEGSLAAVELVKEKGKISLSRYKVSVSLKELAEGDFLKGKEAVISLPTQIFLFRSFLVPPQLKSENKEKDIASFLLRQNLPFKLEECFWNTFIFNNYINLLAARKEGIEKYLKQIEELGLSCVGVTASFMALYNIFIYNYGGRQDNDRFTSPLQAGAGFTLLNVKNSSCELFIYDKARIWVYPLAIGRRDFKDAKETAEKFSAEILRTFNSHSLQNPASGKVSGALYVSQGDFSEALISYLKGILSELEILVFEPFKKIGLPDTVPIQQKQLLVNSIGCALGYLNPAPSFNINLIKEKIKKESDFGRTKVFKKASFYFAIFILVYLFLLDAASFRRLLTAKSAYKNSQLLVSSVFGQAKTLKEEKEKLLRLNDYLGSKLKQQKLYIKTLAMISESKSDSLEIREFEGKAKDGALLVNLSGKASAYETINDFLANLKKNDDIRDVKIAFSSSHPTDEKAIAFKIRFETQ